VAGTPGYLAAQARQMAHGKRQFHIVIASHACGESRRRDGKCSSLARGHPGVRGSREAGTRRPPTFDSPRGARSERRVRRHDDGVVVWARADRKPAWRSAMSTHQFISARLFSISMVTALHSWQMASRWRLRGESLPQLSAEPILDRSRNNHSGSGCIAAARSQLHTRAIDRCARSGLYCREALRLQS
jgi:hypothetical protein